MIEYIPKNTIYYIKYFILGTLGIIFALIIVFNISVAIYSTLGLIHGGNWVFYQFQNEYFKFTGIHFSYYIILIIHVLLRILVFTVELFIMKKFFNFCDKTLNSISDKIQQQ